MLLERENNAKSMSESTKLEGRGEGVVKLWVGNSRAPQTLNETLHGLCLICQEYNILNKATHSGIMIYCSVKYSNINCPTLQMVALL